MNKNIMTVNKGLAGIDTLAESGSSLSKFIRGKFTKVLFVLGGIGAVVGVNELNRNADYQADQIFFSQQENISSSSFGRGEQGDLGTNNNGGMNNDGFNGLVKSDEKNEKQVEDILTKKEDNLTVDKDNDQMLTGVSLVNEVDNQDMRISIENNNLKVVLHKDARDLILENDQDNGIAFIAVIPVMGVGNGYEGTFDPNGINYIPLNKVFEGNGGEGEVMVIVDNGENNNSFRQKLNIRNGKMVVGGDFVVNNSTLPDFLDK